MSHTRPRPRHPITLRRARALKLLGFRYSSSRDAYVLRLVGNHYGPVYQIPPPAPANAVNQSGTR